MIRKFFGFSISILLASCATGGPENLGNQSVTSLSTWKVDRSKSRLTDEVTKSASVTTTDVKITSNLGRFNAAVLSVTCISKKPTVMMHFGWPIGTSRTAIVSYRADQNKAQSPNVKFVGTDAFLIEDAAARTLIDEVVNANLLYVQVSATSGNSATADFRVYGGKDAISQVLAECPFPAVSSRPRSR